MLRWRLILGAGLIATLACLVWLDHSAATPGLWLFPLALVASLLGASDMARLLRAKDARPVQFGALLIVASNAVPIFATRFADASPLGRLGWPLLALLATTFVFFALEMRRYREQGGATVELAKSLFGVLYVGLPLSLVVQLRILVDRQWGLVALISLIAVTKMSDIGAYTVGRLMGRHKMAPVLSPGKTWEGAAGGLLFSVLASGIVLVGFAPSTGLGAGGETVASAWSWIVYGLAVGGAGMAGDLAESLIKRDGGQKDSGPWVPGFGGVLDILDSILGAAPVAYLFWALGWIGP